MRIQTGGFAAEQRLRQLVRRLTQVKRRRERAQAFGQAGCRQRGTGCGKQGSRMKNGGVADDRDALLYFEVHGPTSDRDSGIRFDPHATGVHFSDTGDFLGDTDGLRPCEAGTSGAGEYRHAVHHRHLIDVDGVSRIGLGQSRTNRVRDRPGFRRGVGSIGPTNGQRQEKKGEGKSKPDGRGHDGFQRTPRFGASASSLSARPLGIPKWEWQA